MKISTKRGDQGLTDIQGKRIEKSSEIIDALGAVDEATAALLLADCYSDIPYIQEIVLALSAVGSALAGYISIFDHQLTGLLEEAIEANPAVFTFSYPFKDKGKCYLNQARCQVRLLERKLYLAKLEQPEMLAFVNRLSDYLFSLMIA